MDPAVIGILIGLSTLVGIGGIKYLYHKCHKKEEIPYISNPLLVKRRHSSVKNLFV